MKKFEIYPDELTEKQLLKCIIKKSKFARKYKFKKFYTYNGLPKNWKSELLEDLNESRKTNYKGRKFYVVGGGNGSMNDVVHIFYKKRVYSFDPYYADCSILQKIIKRRKK
jgi:hypothetical protein